MKDMLTRINRISDLLAPNESAIITSDISITYLTGFQHSEGYVVITKENAYMLVDFRYIEDAEKRVSHIPVLSYTSPYKKIGEVLKAEDINTILLERNNVTLSGYDNFVKELKDFEFDATDRLSQCISDMRIVKSECEMEKLRKAQKIAEEAYLELLDFIKIGMTEKEISAKLEYLMKTKGAEKVAFDLITVTGKKTSLPHGVPSNDNKICDGDFITFDIGAVFEGYHSDMTRTIGIGNVTDEQIEIYNIVLKAHLAGLEAVKAGVSGYDVDKTARDIIKEAGYGDYFGHSTGHGVGLEIHEAPYASVKSKDILKVGMTLTVEPGIYLPDKFGVRIEDTVIVTENGYETLASIPKELIILSDY